MSRMQTFSAGQRIFSVDMMHAYINIFKPKAVAVPLSLLEYILDHPSWGDGVRYSVRDVFAKPKKYVDDMERIKNANLKYPILIWKNQKGHYVVDGVHRIAKAFLTKHSKIKAIIFGTPIMKKFLLSAKGDWDMVHALSQADIMQRFYKRFPSK
jgi:hypothetical protein